MVSLVFWAEVGGAMEKGRMDGSFRIGLLSWVDCILGVGFECISQS